MSVIGMMMQPSVSGMSAQSNRLSTVADNIANASTVGYKRADAQFASLLFAGNEWTNIRAIPREMYPAGIVETNIRNLNDIQGALSFTTSTTDLAVDGKGFFVVTDPSAADTTTAYLTRAGSFVENAEGYLINAAGYQLMGYDLANGPAPSGMSGTSGLVPVNIEAIGMTPAPSTAGVFAVNLNSDAPLLGPGVNSPADNQANSVVTSMSELQAYDNQGNVVTLDVYTTPMTDVAPYQWQVVVFDHADATQGGATFFPYGAAGSPPLVTDTLTFDATGQYVSGSPLNIPVPNGQTLALDMSKSTQLAAPYTVRSVTVNGYPPSPVDHVAVTEDGLLRAFFASGNYVDAFQIPLGNVISENKLTVCSNGNVFQANDDSGPVQVWLANTDGNGMIRDGMLEQSTVDIGIELTDMVGAQRAFQASSKAFQVADEATSTIINLR